jgi:protein-S-isoprenylcysteine O-methyltransferase Ste14
MELWQAYGLYGLVWIVFGLLHSALAGPTAKNFLSGSLGNKYRLIYNVVAILTFGLAAWLGLLIFSDAPKLEWGGRAKVWLGFVAVGGWIILFIAAGGYDMRRFMGLSQATRNVSEDEPLRTDGLHRFVRHPLYSAVFLILIGGAWTHFGLATAIFGSLYVIAGTWSEERKLIALYGQEYIDYKEKCPLLSRGKGARFSFDHRKF